MNKSFLASIGKFCLLSLLTCQAAFAFNKAGDISLTAGWGYDYLSSKRHINNSGVPFGVAGYNFSDHWGIEALLGLFHTKSSYPGDEGKDVSATMFALDAVYRFSPYQFVQPYVLAGPGVMGFNPNGNDANNEGNINAAVGAQLFVNEIVAFRFEARDLYTFIGGKNDVFLNAGVTFLIAA